jgi:hypothetical protein
MIIAFPVSLMLVFYFIPGTEGLIVKYFDI